MEHTNYIRKLAFSLWDSNKITDDEYNKIRFHLVELEKAVLPQADVSGSYKPLTLSRIEEIVDETKDLTPKEQTAVAYSMPMTACGLYVLKMKSKYGISVAI